MKRQMIWFASLTLFLTTLMVFGHAQTVDMKVTIPFNFVAEDKTLPAGEYSIARVGRGMEAMRLARNDGLALVTLIPTHVQGQVCNDHGRVIFNKYGNRYFLSEIWRANEDVGLKLHRSGAEADIANGDASERVSVLALPGRR